MIPNRTPMVVGLACAAALVASIVVGSRGMRHFDHALAAYVAGSVIAVFSIAYRLAHWSQRPPTWMYLKRGRQLIPRWKRSKDATRTGTVGLATASNLAGTVVNNYVAQSFIRRRSWERWIMHLGLSYGGMLAFALTFPLVFGWIHFETMPYDAEVYRVFVFGFPVDKFGVHSVKGWVMFNALNISAVMMLVGLVLAVKRRLFDAGERAVQRFQEDWLPLIILLAVAATGLMLTASAKMAAGRGYPVLALAHAVSVIVLLLYIPFGKLFHIFQRVAHLCVSAYKKAGATGPRAHCRRCGVDFASAMHVADLKSVLDQLGYNYRYASPTGELHYQDICPACRRRLLALNQGRTVGR
jgi:hypothetical protein